MRREPQSSWDYRRTVVLLEDDKKQQNADIALPVVNAKDAGSVVKLKD